MSVAAGATRSRARVRFTPRAAVLAAVVLALLLYLAVPFRTYIAQRDRLNRLEKQSEVLEQQNAELQRQVAQLHDPAYLERIARECLGMVKKGEIAFVVVPKTGQPQPADC